MSTRVVLFYTYHEQFHTNPDNISSSHSDDDDDGGGGGGGGDSSLLGC